MFEYGDNIHIVIEHCLEFAQHITKLEIDFTRIELCFDEDAQANTLAKAKAFWIKLGKVFPALDKVVLAGRVPRENSPPAPGTKDEEYTIIETVANCAPNHITTSIAFSDDDFREKPPRRTLWKAPNHLQPTWQVLDEDWRPTRVLLPARKWAPTPLGDFMTYIRTYSALDLESRGLTWLKIQSYLRYAKGGVIYCPRLDCAATFQDEASWKHHLHFQQSDHGHFERNIEDPMLKLWCYKFTPKEEIAAIEAREQRVMADMAEMDRILLRVGYGWGPPGSQQRQYFENLFTAQLREENFFKPGELISHQPWWKYQDWLWLYFDRTHIYHRCPPPNVKHICYKPHVGDQ